MSREISEYDIELGKRFEEIRKRHGLRQLDMATIMETDIGMYKRYAYAYRKCPAEKVYLLAKELQLDVNYVLSGKDTSILDFVKFVGTANFDEIADMFYEVSREMRKKSEAIKKAQRQNPEKPDKGKAKTKKTEE